MSKPTLWCFLILAVNYDGRFDLVSHLSYLLPGCFLFYFPSPGDTRASLFVCHFGLHKSPRCDHWLALNWKHVVSSDEARRFTIASRRRQERWNKAHRVSVCFQLSFAMRCVCVNSECFRVLELFRIQN